MPKSAEEIIDEAVETLFSYRLPIVREALGKLPEPRIPGYGHLDLTRLRLETDQALNGVHPTARMKIDEVTAELDRLQEYGKQHLLLVRFSGDGQQLASLADPEHVKKQLSQIGMADRYNKAHYIDVNHVTDDPVLAEVRHEPGRLICKWVERRTWEEMVETDPGKYEKVTREARAVNFFDLNLVTGAAEVKIQKLKSLAVDHRHKKLQEYLQLASDTLGITGFKPLHLSPAIRHLLSRGDIERTRVRVKLASGGTWEGGGITDVCPEKPEQLRTAVNLEGKWRAHEGRTIRLGIDARISELRILNACSPDQYRAILNDARVWSGEPPMPPPPGTEVGPPDSPQPTPEQTTPGQAAGPTIGVPTRPESTPPGKGPGTTPPVSKPPEQPPQKTRPTESEPPVPKPETMLERLSRIVKESKATATEEPLEGAETVKEVKDYVELEKERVAAGLGATRVQDGLTSWTSEAAVEIFLRHIKKVLADEIKLYQQQLDRLTQDERLVFRLFIASIIMALGFVLVGFVLIATGLLTVGILSSALGGLSGTGWVFIRQLANRLDKRRIRLEERAAERTNLLNAVESSLAQRSWDAMKEVAEKLWLFATAALPKS